MAFRWRSWLFHAGILLSGGLFFALYFRLGGEAADAKEESRITAVAPAAKVYELSRYDVRVVEATSAVERLRVTGTLQPVQRAILRTKNGGRIAELAAREGEQVKAGDVLVRFDTADLHSVLRQREGEQAVAEAEYRLAAQTLKRLEQLGAKNIVSQEQLEKARSGATVARSRLQSLAAQTDLARAALRDAEIRAPFDGVVARRSINAGSRVSPDAELLEIVDTSTLEVRALVSTRDVSRVAIGQSVELHIDGLDPQTVLGKVSRLNPVADDGTRVVSVYIQLSNHDERLRGGMFASGSIQVRKSTDAILIPAISLERDDKGPYVLKLQAGRLVRQPVTVGAAWNGGDTVEISKGLSVGDTIVAVPLPELRPDVAIKFPRAA